MNDGLNPFWLLLVLVAAGLPAMAGAQNYPVKPIRLVVTFAPGGTTDIQARMLVEKLAPRLGQQILIDNRGGAGGNIGMEIVARAPADGYTLVITVVGTWAVNPYLYKLPYDVVRDFAPIIHVATTPGVLVIHPSLPAKTVKELIALARKRPGELAYGTAGLGSFTHISAELFADDDRHPHDARPVQGVRSRDRRSRRRPYSALVQQRRSGDASDPVREAARTGHDRGEAALPPCRICRRSPRLALPVTKAPRGPRWRRPRAPRSR